MSAAIVYLLSPAAAFVTGSSLRIDGGAPNARRGWWELQPVEHDTPFEGFHRSMAPEILADTHE